VVLTIRSFDWIFKAFSFYVQCSRMESENTPLAHSIGCVFCSTVMLFFFFLNRMVFRGKATECLFYVPDVIMTRPWHSANISMNRNNSCYWQNIWSLFLVVFFFLLSRFGQYSPFQYCRLDFKFSAYLGIVVCVGLWVCCIYYNYNNIVRIFGHNFILQMANSSSLFFFFVSEGVKVAV